MMVTRSSPQAAGSEWPGQFTETPLARSEIKSGSFVTVVAESRKGQLVAREVRVVQAVPEGAGR